MAKCKVSLKVINGEFMDFNIPDSTTEDIIESIGKRNPNQDYMRFPSKHDNKTILINMKNVIGITIIEKRDYEDF